MIREVIVEKKIIEYVCDICKTQFKGEYRSKKCLICGREVCNECGHFKSDYSDHISVHCKSCWEVGEKYRLQMDKIIEEQDNAIEKLHEQWKKEALEVI